MMFSQCLSCICPGAAKTWSESTTQMMLSSRMRSGFDSVEHDRFNQWALSIVLKVPVAERWNAHVEYFGIHTDGSAHNRAVHYFSPGVHYLLTADWEIGVRLGWGLNDEASKFFSNVGLGWRF